MNITRPSKFLSLVLRHQPEKFGLKMDRHGWVNVSQLLVALSSQEPYTMETLIEVVDKNDKKRFAFNEDKTKIRAVQGHSVAVDLELKPEIPPDILYHGTCIRFFESICEKGLLAGSRQYVHLSDNIETAKKVGARHGIPMVFGVDTVSMRKHGADFYRSENNVWLAKHVPAMFLRLDYSGMRKL